MSQVTLSKLLNISQASLSRIEDGLQKINPDAAWRMEILSAGTIDRMSLLYPDEHIKKS